MLNQLKHIGLSENEAKVYLAMLELGPSSVLEIAAKAGINRPTAYAQIESLKKMGLISMQTKGKKQLYIAEDPDQLEFLIDREKKDLEQKQDELKEALPELKELFNTTEDRPHVRFFEGKEGLERMQNDLLRSGTKETRGISSADDIYRIFPQHKGSYVSERVKKGIRSKLIYTSSQGAMYKEKDETALREAIHIPKGMLNFHADLDVYGDSISISALTGKLSGIIIHHKDLADSFRTLFDFLWDTYKKNEGLALDAKPPKSSN
ncbi:MAG: hypothetical protein A3J54_03525 [Candidatus Ryanbacteria bacterium RIFCSPHIGHO2_02_FULL_45_13b]|uniref:Transcription regulator TrmB N-terminal domain-containing protein n=1 Tax=Candidatus Ryanbacteria bacterium RIFCSPHIGHO2_02_FULL_45_13b TaxID=1802117 RepID=A0A1G2G5F9_9BACT|nr:MAG: hypothetical protein A3J54_03525 [Candidatus Ryanbacteria bacterium RIFCSPHIGHO2_02_FULL_45_13b]